MPNNSSSSAVTQNLQDALKDLRPVMRRAMELSTADVSAIVIEPILQALGWNTKDPKQARRPDGTSQIKLLSSGKAALTVIAHASLNSVPDSLSEITSDAGEWIIATNGATWNIFNHHNRSQPFRTISLSDAAAARDAAPVLEMLQRDSFLKDSLTEAWMSEAVDQDIERILARHLDGSEALVSTIQESLKAQDITIAADDVRAALSRINISLGGKPAAEMSDAPQEVAAPEPKAATTPAKKTAAAKKPAVAKKAKDTKKPAAAKKAAAPKKPVSAKKAAAAKSTKAETTKSKTTEDTAKPATAGAATQSIATEGTSQTTSDPVAEAAKKSAKNVKLPASPEELGWPSDATHSMHRKKNIVFMNFNEATGESTILPGSLIVADLGKALNPQMIKAREDAVRNGSIVPFGSGMLEVKKPVSLQSSRVAASFAAATLVKDESCWKTKSGEELGANAAPKKRKTLGISTTPKEPAQSQVEATEA